MAKAASASAIGDKEKPKKNACILHAVVADLAALCLHLLKRSAYERVQESKNRSPLGEGSILEHVFVLHGWRPRTWQLRAFFFKNHWRLLMIKQITATVSLVFACTSLLGEVIPQQCTAGNSLHPLRLYCKLYQR